MTPKSASVEIQGVRVVSLLEVVPRVGGTGHDRKTYSGVALCSSGNGPPLVLSMLPIQPRAQHFAAFAMRRRKGITTDAIHVELRHVASVPIVDADNAFASLAARGWFCCTKNTNETATRFGRFRLHLLRATESLSRSEALLEPPFHAAWSAEPDDAWVGTRIRVVTPCRAGTLLHHIATYGIVSNISAPPGLILTDACCFGPTVGGAVLLEDSVSCTESNSLIACVAPLLQNRTGETVAFSLAIPLAHIMAALLDNPVAAKLLQPEEIVTLSSNVNVHDLPSTQAVPRTLEAAIAAARRGVVLLWVEGPGRWASGIIVSKMGHVLTCAHLLTGQSWMESSPEALQGKDKQSAAVSAKLPKQCRGRGEVWDESTGCFVEVSFDAKVLYPLESESMVPLDVALLHAQNLSINTSSTQQSRTTSSAALGFVPLKWSVSPLALAADVWSVGYGLFGPGTPWRGPSVSQGQVAKVTPGERTGRPALVQSSTAVHRGSSGGALVSVESMEVLGLLTTNVKKQGGSVMPDVNFSLPVAMLEPPLRSFLREPDRPGATELLAEQWRSCAADEQEMALWRLEPDPLDLPSHEEERRRHALERLNQCLADEAEVASKTSEEERLSAAATANDSALTMAVHRGPQCLAKVISQSNRHEMPTPRSCL